MRFIPTRVHGGLDYLLGAALMLAPRRLGFSDDRRAASVPIALGAGALLYSLFTDYELGLVRKLPMALHLQLDAGGGLFMAASPWLLGFADRIRAPHVALGLLELASALTTKTTPSGARRGRPA